MTDPTKLADLLEMAMERRSSDAFGRTSTAWVSAVAQLIDENRVVVIAALRAAPAAEIPRADPYAHVVAQDGRNSSAEVEAWETFARGHKLDMTEHPLHYLFLDEKTDAARQAWKAAISFMHDAAINGPAACSPAQNLGTEEGVGSAGSGATLSTSDTE